MGVADLLAEVRAAGARISINGDWIDLEASVALPDALLGRLRAAKPEILRFLRSVDAHDTGWSDAHEERAAIVQEATSCPRAWAEALARLDPDNAPTDIPLPRWRLFVDDCGRFIDAGWAFRAAALGWTPLDLFGCDLYRPFARIDAAGLLWLLRGRKLLALSEDTAIIDTRDGGRQTFRRCPVAPGNIVLPWELLP